MSKITPELIASLSYTDFVALLQEENRPSGGKKSVREIINNSFITPKSRVLEVGCTNGFTSLEVSRTVGCEVIGIDIAEESIKLASLRATGMPNISFRCASAYDIPFDNNYFDLVIAGNATSFMADKNAALKEYLRVVKNFGFIATVPIWYPKPPSKEIINEVSKEINVQITPMSRADWLSLFASHSLEVYSVSDYYFDHKNSGQIEEYARLMLDKPHLRLLSKESRLVAEQRWIKTVSVFNKNLALAAYSVVLLRKRDEPEELEFFTSRSASHSDYGAPHD